MGSHVCFYQRVVLVYVALVLSVENERDYAGGFLLFNNTEVHESCVSCISYKFSWLIATQ